jgi:hypothetical protein
MQLCIFIFYLLTVRRHENKVFSAAFAAENTSFPAGGAIEIIIIILVTDTKKLFSIYKVLL